MPPSIAPPSPDVLARLLDEHAHRYPQKAKLRAPGDGGAELVLPILVAIPTGAVRLADGDETLPNGRKPSAAWSRLVAASLGFRDEGPDDGADLVSDCLLWPLKPTWREWLERWPGLDGPALRVVKEALARHGDAVQAPDEGDEPPPGMGAQSVWRKLRPAKGIERGVVVNPPAADTWRIYLNAAREPGANVGALTRDVVDHCTGGTAGDLLDRYPGLVISLAKTAAYLAGAGAEAELGNW